MHSYENGNCIQCDAYLESEHNYTDLFDKTWTICRKNAKSITITFSAETFVETGYDFIYLYDANDNFIGEYTGDALALKSINVLGDTVKIRLKTDRSLAYYGFKLIDIFAEYIWDINSDGELDVLDLVKFKKILAGTGESNNISPDIDGDGIVSATDLAFLRRLVLNS